jgi:hypothetical protein
MLNSTPIIVKARGNARQVVRGNLDTAKISYDEYRGWMTSEFHIFPKSPAQREGLTTWLREDLGL